MNAKTLLRVIVFLGLVFVMLYVGMENPQRIDFNFPILLDKRITEHAAIIFFAMFAIGVVAGTMLHFSSGGPARKSEGGGGKKK